MAPGPRLASGAPARCVPAHTHRSLSPLPRQPSRAGPYQLSSSDAARPARHPTTRAGTRPNGRLPWPRGPQGWLPLPVTTGGQAQHHRCLSLVGDASGAGAASWGAAHPDAGKCTPFTDTETLLPTRRRCTRLLSPQPRGRPAPSTGSARGRLRSSWKADGPSGRQLPALRHALPQFFLQWTTKLHRLQRKKTQLLLFIFLVCGPVRGLGRSPRDRNRLLVCLRPYF